MLSHQSSEVQVPLFSLQVGGVWATLREPEMQHIGAVQLFHRYSGKIRPHGLQTEQEQFVEVDWSRVRRVRKEEKEVGGQQFGQVGGALGRGRVFGREGVGRPTRLSLGMATACGERGR